MTAKTPALFAAAAAPLAVLAAATLAAAPARAANVEIEATGPVIELQVTETIEAEPDLVTIGAGVSSDAPTAVEAMRANAAAMKRVIERLRALGIESKDIQTTGISLNPRYDYNRETSQNEFRGYTAGNRVNVRLRAIEETGEVLDALVVAGATDLSGPDFALENDTAAKAEARQRALALATERAREYGAMLGYDDYRVLEIAETIQRSGVMPRSGAKMLAIAADAEAAPVEPGMVTTGVSLTITFELVEAEAAEAGDAGEP